MSEFKSLYRENLSYNDAGSELADEAGTFVYRLLERYLGMGYSPREASQVIQGITQVHESQIVMNWQHNKRNEERVRQYEESRLAEAASQRE